MNVTRLLIGGNRAGDLVSVDKDLRHLRMPVMHKLNSFELSKAIGEQKHPDTFKVENYRLERISDGGSDYHVFVAHDCNPIVELLKGYRPILSETHI